MPNNPEPKPIRILPPDLINKIAAGEVVERPASIVKELVENSIDAGATEIKVRIEKGGIQLIEVIDNGCGLDQHNAELAFTQHATSKITSIEDLNNIISLGFRGEALASIASVSEAQMHTNVGDNPILIKASEHDTVCSPGHARLQGTTITIRNLFHNIPARRKFLRSEATEFKHIQDIFISLALTQNQISFALEKDGKQVYHFKSTSDLAERIAQIFSIASVKLIPVHYDDPRFKIGGYIGHPSIARYDTSQQFLIINGRIINDRLINKAIKDGYATTLMQGRQPVYFLQISMPAAELDVNIHPRKLEAKYADPGRVFANIKKAVNYAISKQTQTELRHNFGDQNLPEQNPPQQYNSGSDHFSPELQRHSATPSTSIGQSLAFSKTILEFDTQTELLAIAPSEESYDCFQILNTYIIIEKNGRLLIIDQHAADERIKFEQIEQRFANQESIPSTQLLIPENLTLTASRKELVIKYEKQLHHMGFSIKKATSSQTILTTVPSLLAQKNYLESLDLILHDLEHTPENNSASFQQTLEKIYATLACHGSIRAGRHLDKTEMQKIVSDLFDCKLPYSCPHGRPIIWQITKDELEKNFKRKL